MKKKGNKKMSTPKHKLIHNPILTSLFLSDTYLSFVDEDSAGTSDTLLTRSMFIQTNNDVCRDGVINEFLFWCRHPHVPLLFCHFGNIFCVYT